MAVRIRLRRIGKKKQPQYRLVAAEAAGPRDGRFIEVIGHYNPRTHPRQEAVDAERALWWLRQGAQPSEAARLLLVRTGVWERFAGATPAAPAESAAAEIVAEATEPEDTTEEEVESGQER